MLSQLIIRFQDQINVKKSGLMVSEIRGNSLSIERILVVCFVPMLARTNTRKSILLKKGKTTDGALWKACIVIIHPLTVIKQV
ncbi:hypothetical protein D3C78_1690900 [compost metagenome]